MENLLKKTFYRTPLSSTSHNGCPNFPQLCKKNDHLAVYLETYCPLPAHLHSLYVQVNIFLFTRCSPGVQTKAPLRNKIQLERLGERLNNLRLILLSGCMCVRRWGITLCIWATRLQLLWFLWRPCGDGGVSKRRSSIGGCGANGMRTTFPLLLLIQIQLLTCLQQRIHAWEELGFLLVRRVRFPHKKPNREMCCFSMLYYETFNRINAVHVCLSKTL